MVNMNSTMTIEQMASKVEHEAHNRADFIVPAGKMEMWQGRGGVEYELEIDGNGFYVPTRLAHKQIAERLDIPKKFYDMTKDKYEDLFVTTVNYLLGKNEPQMVRTVEDRARAVLSDRYMPLDNYELLRGAVLPTLLGQKMQQHARVVSASISEEKMFIKVVSEKLTGEVTPGDVIQGGFIISNSEVGLGAVSIQFFMYRLVCSNGMIGESLMRKYHVGTRETVSDNVKLSSRTKELTTQATLSKVQDMLTSATDEDMFELTMSQLRKATTVELTSPEKAVERVANLYNFNADEQSSIMDMFIKGGDTTQYGLMNAITAAARVGANSDYQRATEIEASAMKVVTVSPKFLNQ